MFTLNYIGNKVEPLREWAELLVCLLACLLFAFCFRGLGFFRGESMCVFFWQSNTWKSDRVARVQKIRWRKIYNYFSKRVKILSTCQCFSRVTFTTFSDMLGWGEGRRLISGFSSCVFDSILNTIRQSARKGEKPLGIEDNFTQDEVHVRWLPDSHVWSMEIM